MEPDFGQGMEYLGNILSTFLANNPGISDERVRQEIKEAMPTMDSLSSKYKTNLIKYEMDSPETFKNLLLLCQVPLWNTVGKSHCEFIFGAGRHIVSQSIFN